MLHIQCKTRLASGIVALAVIAAPLGAVTLSISPNWIVECSGGYGRATLTWDDPGSRQVQVRVNGRNGPPLTLLISGPGSATTGDWVGDGTVFSLVNDQEAELARVTARVNCGGTANAVESALSGAYLPLQVGNRWVYRSNSRSATSTYVAWELTGTVLGGDRTYYVLSTSGLEGQPVETLLRADAEGRVYRLESGRERLWLDPASPSNPDALLQIIGRNPVALPGLGSFPDGIQYSSFLGLNSETGSFVRGLGLASSSTNLVTGSSGGFLSSLELVEARIAGRLRLALAAPAVQLSAEAVQFDVTGKRAANCAVPCYFVACGLVPGADPPNTYKPCFQARLGVNHRSAASADIELLEAGGRSVYRATRSLTPGSGETFFFQQVSLYSAPSVGFPPGEYRVNAILRTALGGSLGTASLNLRIE